MKKYLILGIAFLLIGIIGVLVFKSISSKGNTPIYYDYKHSYHEQFYFENGYVVFATTIKLKNTSSKDQYFYLYADVSEDYGLVLENTAVACEKNSLDKMKFFMKAKSENDFGVYFKAEKGKKSIKQNRLPPQNLRFEMIE